MSRRVYIAAPLFSEADRDFNEKVTRRIEEELGFECYLPQRNKAINNKENCANSIDIYNNDTFKLQCAETLVCFLDGNTIDPGVACEIGYVNGLNENDDYAVKIIGLLTDSRDGTHTINESTLKEKMKFLAEDVGESQFSYLNLYVVGAIKKYGTIVSSVDELIEELKKGQE